MKKICPYCKKEFETPYEDKIYHSDKCKRYFTYRKNKRGVDRMKRKNIIK